MSDPAVLRTAVHQARLEGRCAQTGHQWGTPIMNRRRCLICNYTTDQIARIPTAIELGAWVNGSDPAREPARIIPPPASPSVPPRDRRRIGCRLVLIALGLAAYAALVIYLNRRS